MGISGGETPSEVSIDLKTSSIISVLSGMEEVGWEPYLLSLRESGVRLDPGLINPGSLNSFFQREEVLAMDSDEERLQAWYVALHLYRVALTVWHNTTPEDLHSLSFAS